MAIKFNKSNHSITVENPSELTSTLPINIGIVENNTGLDTSKYIPFVKSTLTIEGTTYTSYQVVVKELIETDTSTISYVKSSGSLTCNEIIEI